MANVSVTLLDFQSRQNAFLLTPHNSVSCDCKACSRCALHDGTSSHVTRSHRQGITQERRGSNSPSCFCVGLQGITRKNKDDRLDVYVRAGKTCNCLLMLWFSKEGTVTGTETVSCSCTDI